MKHIGIYTGVLAAFALPSVVVAQVYDSSGALQTLISFEDSSKMLESVSLIATLIIAFATSAMVWMGGRKMQGGVFGSVFNFFSLGMTLVFLGFLAEIPWFQGVSGLYLKMAHDSLYIIGYIMMGLAANKLFKAIKGE